MKAAVAMPTGRFSFSNPTSTPKAPSYALAASKHVPNQPATPTPTVFRPILHKKQPPPPPPAVRPVNTITLAQSDEDKAVLTDLNYPSLIGLINTKLAAANVKANVSDKKAIRIRSVH